MKSTVIVLETDKNYLNHARYLISCLIDTGKWRGDICLITCGVTSEDVADFTQRGVIIKEIPPDTETYYIKFYAFEPFFKKWSFVCHIDLDFLIFGDMNTLLLQNIPLLDSADLVADAETFTIKETLANFDHCDFVELSHKIDINRPNFNAGFFIYSTKILHDDYISFLFNEREKYKEINKHNGLPGGADQPILNIIFYNRWAQVKSVCYYTKYSKDTIGLHTCRWSSPWTKHVAHYKRALEIFRYVNGSKEIKPAILIITMNNLYDKSSLNELFKNAWYPSFSMSIEAALTQGVPESIEYVVFANEIISLSSDWDKRLRDILINSKCTIISPINIHNKDSTIKKLKKRWLDVANNLIFRNNLFHHRLKIIRSIAKRGFWKQVPNDWYYALLPQLYVNGFNRNFFMTSRRMAVELLSSGTFKIPSDVKSCMCVDVFERNENSLEEFCSLLDRLNKIETICRSSKIQRTFSMV